MDDEVGGAFCFEFLFPAGVGLADFGGADVEALDVGGAGSFGEEFGEDAGLIGSSAGEVEEVEVVFFLQVGVEEVTKVFFQSREIGLEVFVEGSVGHGGMVGGVWEIWNGEFGMVTGEGWWILHRGAEGTEGAQSLVGVFF